MDRKEFLQTMGLLPLLGCTMKSKELNKLNEKLPNTEKLPVLFLGHGSPMNAIEENDFVRGLRSIGSGITRPKAILCISAHWETKGTYVTAMENPRTIHDFGGFPKELYEVQYPAPGSPALAKETQDLVKTTSVQLDQNWGLDHGAWSVIKHLYPAADIPVIQMSLDYSKPPSYHYQIAKELSTLRSKGILIVGSGNMVHNLGMVAWDKMNQPDYAYEWAKEASSQMKSFITTRNHSNLINYAAQGESWQLAIPSPEHYLPLLYVLGLQDENEEATLYNDKAVAGSLTMTSVKIG
jgi:4,5-DOPA dioxygenase extradiol